MDVEGIQYLDVHLTHAVPGDSAVCTVHRRRPWPPLSPDNPQVFLFFLRNGNADHNGETNTGIAGREVVHIGQENGPLNPMIAVVYSYISVVDGVGADVQLYSSSPVIQSIDWGFGVEWYGFMIFVHYAYSDKDRGRKEKRKIRRKLSATKPGSPKLMQCNNACSM